MNALALSPTLFDATDLSRFVQQHRRLPRLGDVPAPWTFRGWLLPYVIELHAYLPAVADRWGYHLRMLEAGKLLDEPIPQIAFGTPDHKVFALLRDWARLINHDCGGWSDFRTLLDWLCWGLALTDEQPHLSDAIHEKLYRQVNLAPLLEHPYDYLGDFVSLSRSTGWNPTAFFPTPHPVVELMVRMTMHKTPADGRDPRTLTVNDPCVGSGRMLLHASNFSFCLYGQDIDPLAVVMCKINGALYAPWMSYPLPASLLQRHVEPASDLLRQPSLLSFLDAVDPSNSDQRSQWEDALAERYGVGKYAMQPEVLIEAMHKRMAFRTTQAGGKGRSYVGELSFREPPSPALREAALNQLHGHIVQNSPTCWTVVSETRGAHQSTGDRVRKFVQAGMEVEKSPPPR